MTEMILTEREQNLAKGVKETLNLNDATIEEKINVCKFILKESGDVE